MSTNLTWQTQIDKPLWIPEATALANTAAGSSLACDLRNNNTRVPLLFELTNATSLGVYNPMLTDWLQLTSPALTGTFGAGATCIFHPTQGARSKLLASSTTTTLNLDGFGNGAPAAATWTRTTTTATVTTTANHGFQSGQILTVTITSDATAIVLGNVTITVTGNTTFTFTCLNAGAASGTLTVGISLGTGVLGNKGDGAGFVIRVIDNGAGGSGKTEEAFILTNTAGATPVVTLASALSFTPVTGSSFELLSGRLFMLSAGTTAFGCWKYYDVASQKTVTSGLLSGFTNPLEPTSPTLIASTDVESLVLVGILNQSALIQKYPTINLSIRATPSTTGAAFEAKVLQGVWAAAPYLHNGSVPSLAELLKPVASRVKSFLVGPKYDIVKIGLATQQPSEPSSLYVTTGCSDLNSGNSNCGHEGPRFGTWLSPKEKAELLEYLKTL